MAVFSLASGLVLWLGIGIGGGWLKLKLVAVLLLIGFHISMRIYMKRMQSGGQMPGSVALRWYNEVPLLILLAILYLVVFKPY
jgi:putative membrane protein